MMIMMINMNEREGEKEGIWKYGLQTEWNCLAVITEQALLSEGACYVYYVHLTAPLNSTVYLQIGPQAKRRGKRYFYETPRSQTKAYGVRRLQLQSQRLASHIKREKGLGTIVPKDPRSPRSPTFLIWPHVPRNALMCIKKISFF